MVENVSPVVIVGSNSFSGAHFAHHCLKQGAEVIAISRSAEPIAAFLPYRWSPPSSALTFIQGDLNHDLDRIMGTIREAQAPLVVNFAAQSMVAESWTYPEHWMMTNVVSSVKFHNQLRQCAFLKKYVHISTPEVYGNCVGVVTEEAPFNPSTPYAVSRAASDMNLKAYHAAYGFPVVFTRAANVYGPGQQLYRIIPRAILSIKLGQKIPLHGGGVSRRSFIHMRDVCEATWAIAQQAVPGETYHISTPELISIRALVELICDKMGVTFSEVVEMQEERLGKDLSYALDSTKLRTQLGWKEYISLSQGIDETLAWVEQNFNELKQEPLNYKHKA